MVILPASAPMQPETPSGGHYMDAEGDGDPRGDD
jgi:hypothetical protein